MSAALDAPRLCILTAGKGDRMGGLCDVINKALLPVHGRAVISHIVDKFPTATPIVVGLGYKGRQVRDFLLASYPGRELVFVEIDNFDQPGAGPGYSLRQCRAALRDEPFYFAACDLLVDDDIPLALDRDWMGVCKVNHAISERYCNFTIENDLVVDMVDKEPYRDHHSKSFIGLCFVRDTATFWQGLEERHLHKGEWQMTNGIKSLIDRGGVRAVDFHWTDVGAYQQYVDACSANGGFDFGKTDEFIYLNNGRVVKFFKDAKVVANRAARSRLNQAAFPRLDYVGEQLYAYPLVEGASLYQHNDIELFQRLLSWLEATLWLPGPADGLREACRDFYVDKTRARYRALLAKYPSLAHNRKTVNGRVLPSMEELLERVDWTALTDDCIPRFIHGDLQFDNILHGPGGFTLIDWRQDFAGQLEVGDLYYDLAKLAGGLILNYDLIKANAFSFAESDTNLAFDFSTRYSMRHYRDLLEAFVEARGWSLAKVRQLVGLIYLNMAPLHHFPFDKLLFALATETLEEALARR